MLPKLIHIPKPCHEDWNKMSSTQKGAFCQSCKKEVYDLTNKGIDNIKKLFENSENPCVRVTQQKLDELNFFEWFNHLNLKKRLKYLFLFAILIAQNSLRAQESDCYEPQFVAVDSVDLLSEQELSSEILNQNEAPENEQFKWEWPETATVEPFVSGYPWIISGGMTLGSISQPEKKRNVGVPSFIGDVVDIFSQDHIEFESTIELFGNFYSFSIHNDSLFIEYDTQYEQKITLKISQDQWGPFPYPNKNIVFFAPLKLSKGIGQLKYPIKNFPAGSFTFIVSYKNEVGVARLTKW